MVLYYCLTSLQVAEIANSFYEHSNKQALEEYFAVLRF